MSTLTIRLPDETANRLKALAKSRGLSTNEHMGQMGSHALVALDSENHMRVSATTCNRQRASDILDRLEAEIGSGNH